MFKLSVLTCCLSVRSLTLSFLWWKNLFCLLTSALAGRLTRRKARQEYVSRSRAVRLWTQSSQTPSHQPRGPTYTFMPWSSTANGLTICRWARASPSGRQEKECGAPPKNRRISFHSIGLDGNSEDCCHGPSLWEVWILSFGDWLVCAWPQAVGNTFLRTYRQGDDDKVTHTASCGGSWRQASTQARKSIGIIKSRETFETPPHLCVWDKTRPISFIFSRSLSLVYLHVTGSVRSTWRQSLSASDIRTSYFALLPQMLWQSLGRSASYWCATFFSLSLSGLEQKGHAKTFRSLLSLKGKKLAPPVCRWISADISARSIPLYSLPFPSLLFLVWITLKWPLSICLDYTKRFICKSPPCRLTSFSLPLTKSGLEFLSTFGRRWWWLGSLDNPRPFGWSQKTGQKKLVITVQKSG